MFIFFSLNKKYRFKVNETPYAKKAVKTLPKQEKKLAIKAFMYYNQKGAVYGKREKHWWDKLLFCRL